MEDTTQFPHPLVGDFRAFPGPRAFLQHGTSERSKVNTRRKRGFQLLLPHPKKGHPGSP